MECFKKLFLQQPLSKDDGEWIQPVQQSNKRHESTVAESTMGRKTRASISIDSRDIHWGDMVTNLSDMSVADLDNAEFDDDVFAAVDNASNMRDSDLVGTLGRITMGSLFSEDSVSFGLGGFTRTGHRPSLDTTSDEHEEEKRSTGSSGKENVSSSGHSGEIVGILRSKDPCSDKSPTSLFKAKAKNVMFATAALKRFATTSSSSADTKSSDVTVSEPTRPAITSIATLGDGYFLAASRHENTIKMHKTAGEKVEFVREFKGHKSGVTALCTLCKKGRFISAGVGSNVILWDSRFDIEEDSDDEEAGMPIEPLVILGNFTCFERYVHHIAVLDEGSFVRPTDDVDMAMVAAMAKKTALEGAASVQRAAIQREIIQCSGSFATASKNEKNVKIWSIAVADKTDENAATIILDHELEHTASIGALAAMKNTILTGDNMGIVHVWGRKQKTFGNQNSWTTLHKLTPWRKNARHTPDQMLEQSIQALCFLDKGTYVSGTKSGTVRVWNNLETAEVYKKSASSVKVTSKTVTDIQELPPVKDPNTGEECMAFSASFSDGRMVSMAMYPEDPSEQEKNELVMFHVYSNSSLHKSSDAINTIAVSKGGSGVSGSPLDPVLIAGDSNGHIKTLKPKWNSLTSASV